MLGIFDPIKKSSIRAKRITSINLVRFLSSFALEDKEGLTFAQSVLVSIDLEQSFS
jgi:hypothetical protein